MNHPDLFLCYSRHDQEIAYQALTALESGGLWCWSYGDIGPGEPWEERIGEAIERTHVFVLILSRHANESRQVLEEVERVRHLNKPIVCFRAEAVTLPDALEHFTAAIHWVEATTIPRQALPDLVRMVKRLLPGGDLPIAAPRPIPSAAPESFELPKLPSPQAMAESVSETWSDVGSWLGRLFKRDGDSPKPTPPAPLPPRPASEALKFSTYAPATVQPGEEFLITATAQLASAQAEADAMALALDDRLRRVGTKALDAGVPRGTLLSFQLQMNGATVKQPVRAARWLGETLSVEFVGQTPATLALPRLLATVDVFVDSIPMSSLSFSLGVTGEKPARPAYADTQSRAFRRAFISYASEDRPEVVKRLQGFSKAGIDYFADVLRLEPGERWERKLYETIDDCDLFLLFWSAAARRSEWVRREYLYADAVRRQHRITLKPVILEGPPPPDPPAELADLHFNDPLLYFIGKSSA